MARMRYEGMPLMFKGPLNSHPTVMWQKAKATPWKMSCSNSLVQVQKLVEQLQLEASMERIKISLTAVDLVQYCQDHRRSDPLITSVAASSNPFKDKKSCVLL
ncbi:guanine nucleotide-binding protein G(I)/G(S)/G(O) subunit gamma-7-like isoform X2 [Phyllopteryx taeniolatus]|uniref:guanine nucleotide-binding protein G(I)/G(S)/G(O) subunit gamma-7-like isoform X2 n=1 Tax=Phyllopteryx taeniolatus TaxID=161469 RepID=UPI002AD49AAE|nr:guanine nucleotide-binding protein G(I)/G(S)/G(O) subunit gamma-7-like isoform X2 [Phyllopteryx taeniolatus]